MKKLFLILGIALALVLTGCANGQSDSSDDSTKQEKPADNTKQQGTEGKKSVKVQWNANTSRTADRSASVDTIKVHFYKVPVKNMKYEYAEAVEIDSFEIKEGDSLDKDYKEQVPDGYILGFSADNYVMKSKANDGYVINGKEVSTFFELRFETLGNGRVLPSTLLGSSVKDEELYDLSKVSWIYEKTTGEGTDDEAIYFKTDNYLLNYWGLQAIVEVISNTGYLCYWFCSDVNTTIATDEDKTLAKSFIKERFGITEHI